MPPVASMPARLYPRTQHPAMSSHDRSPNPLKRALDALMARMHGPVYRTRITGLVAAIQPHLQENDTVLDIGCGFGDLGRALMDHPDSPQGLVVRGIERAPRPGAKIEIDAYPGDKLPYEDNHFDAVIIADVLHHEPQPDNLLAEAARVAKRRLIIKDHQVKGPLAQPRISLMDWAANSPYGVPCLFQYPSPQGWEDQRNRLGLKPVEVRPGMQLYPAPYKWVFTPALQHFAVIDATSPTPAPAGSPASTTPASA